MNLSAAIGIDYKRLSVKAIENLSVKSINKKQSEAFYYSSSSN
jgi:hypothetical protein